MTAVTSQIAVYRRSTGALEHLAPAALAPAVDDPTFASVALPSGFDESLFLWNATAKAMVEDPAKVEARLIATIKTEAERRKMLVMSPGGAKKTEYADQSAEVRFFWSLGGTVQAIMGVLGLWSAERRAAVFPCAVANAAEFGDTIDKAIGRFMAGMAGSTSKNAIAAREQKLCAAIRSASGAAAKKAVPITWP